MMTAWLRTPSLLVVAFLPLTATTGRASCVPASPMPRIHVGSNCIYDVAMNEGVLAGTGSHAARTSQAHPVTIALGRPQSVVQGSGTTLLPSLAAFSLRSWSGQHDVLFDIPANILRDDNGVTCDVAFAHPHRMAPILDPAGSVVGQSVAVQVMASGEVIAVDLLIAARGSAADDSAVEMTAVVTNAGTSPIAVGGRFAWTVYLWNYPHIAWTPSPQEAASEPWLVAEEEYLSPAYGHIVLSDSRYPSRIASSYYAGLSCLGPARLNPPPTPPDRIAFGHDPSSRNPADRGGPFSTCFDWHPRTPRPPTPAGDRGLPEVMAYWWGDTPATAIWLAPGESKRFTLWEWAYLENPLTCDAGGPIVAECEGGVTRVVLDGRASSSSGGSSIWHEWSSPDPRVGFDDAGSPSPTAEFPGVGMYSVHLRVGVGPFERECETTVEVRDTRPPRLTADAPVTVLSSTLADCHARLALRAMADDACDAAPVVTHVTIPDIGAGGSVADHAFPLGTTRVVFTARDASGNQTTAETSVTVVDDVAPSFIRLSPSPDVLWPPRHRFVPVTVDINVADDCDATPSVVLVGATSSEPADDRSDGRTSPDIAEAESGTDDRLLLLRSERAGTGRGREYRLAYRVTDGSGNATEGAAVVRAPHDRRP